MGWHRNWSLRPRLKTAVKKLNFVVRFLTESKWRKWRLAASICGTAVSRRRSWSSNDDRYIGLQQCIEDQDQCGSGGSSSPVRALQRTTTCVYYSFSDDSDHRGDVDDDVDKRAEIFISNFRRRLLYERQVSLQLRYGRRNSFQ